MTTPLDTRFLTPSEDREDFKKHILPHIFWLSVLGGAVLGGLIWIACFCLRHKSDGSGERRGRRRRMRRRDKDDDDDDDASPSGVQLARIPSGELA